MAAFAYEATDAQTSIDAKQECRCFFIMPIFVAEVLSHNKGLIVARIWLKRGALHAASQIRGTRAGEAGTH